MKAKTIAMRTAKKCAEIVTKNDVMNAAAAMVVAMGMTGADAEAAKAAFEDMADELTPSAVIVDMNTFHGFIA